MGRPCSICTRADRKEIERRLVAGEPLLVIAKSVHAGRDALRNHAAHHLPGNLAAMPRGRRTRTRDACARPSRGPDRRRRAVLVSAQAEGLHESVLAAIRELRNLPELIARLTGELDQRPQVVVDLAGSAEWKELQAAIVGALEPFPEARMAVTAAIAKVAK